MDAREEVLDAAEAEVEIELVVPVVDDRRGWPGEVFEGEGEALRSFSFLLESDPDFARESCCMQVDHERVDVGRSGWGGVGWG